MAGDWVKLHRRMLTSAIMADDWICRLWVWCLLKASYDTRRTFGVIVEPGEFIVTKQLGAALLGVSPSRFHRGLQRLSALGCIALKANRERTTITIVNWRTYQDIENEIEPQADHERTASGLPLLEKERKKGRREEGRGRLADLASEVLQVWNAQPFQKARAITDSRFRCLQARSADSAWLATWQEAIARAAQSSFLRGQNDRKWVADIDWFLRPDSVNRVLEGKYDDRAAKQETFLDVLNRKEVERCAAINGTLGPPSTPRSSA